MTKKKLLILGATGFIGRNLAEHYAALPQYEVYGSHFSRAPLELERVQMRYADLRCRDQVDALLRGMDIVIQTAAVTTGSKDVINTPYIHVTDNAVMNSLIFRSAFEQSVGHLVFPSCSVMYQSSDSPLAEHDFDANRALHPSYFGAGWNKIYLEKMCEFYAGLGRNKFTVMRHTNVYGPYDKYDLEKSHVFGASVAKVMTSSDGKIRIWGSGEERRDLLHVSDLVRFVDHALRGQAGAFGLYNVGSGQAISVRELVEKIIKHSGKPLALEHDLSAPSIKTSVCLDCSKARDELDWEPLVAIDDGIRRTLEWYAAQQRS
jgi:GDP-L-fucose synthase